MNLPRLPSFSPPNPWLYQKIKHGNSDEINEQQIKCDFCTKKFVNQQRYSVHLKCKHKR